MVFDIDEFDKAYTSDRLYLLYDQIKKEQEFLEEVKLVALDENNNPININTHATGELQGNTKEWSEPRSRIFALPF